LLQNIRTPVYGFIKNRIKSIGRPEFAGT